MVTGVRNNIVPSQYEPADSLDATRRAAVRCRRAAATVRPVRVAGARGGTRHSRRLRSGPRRRRAEAAPRLAPVPAPARGNLLLLQSPDAASAHPH